MSVPDREGNTEEALARNEPVAVESLDPVLVPDLHEVGVPFELGAALQKGFPQSSRAFGPATIADVPLPGGHDFEGAVALFEEFHSVGYLLGLRSEEHTSELQSRGHLVCRLLLEKKNNTI